MHNKRGRKQFTFGTIRDLLLCFVIFDAVRVSSTTQHRNTISINWLLLWFECLSLCYRATYRWGSWRIEEIVHQVGGLFRHQGAQDLRQNQVDFMGQHSIRILLLVCRCIQFQYHFHWWSLQFVIPRISIKRIALVQPQFGGASAVAASSLSPEGPSSILTILQSMENLVWVSFAEILHLIIQSVNGQILFYCPKEKRSHRL